jgi:hypothetical protein
MPRLSMMVLLVQSVKLQGTVARCWKRIEARGRVLGRGRGRMVAGNLWVARFAVSAAQFPPPNRGTIKPSFARQPRNPGVFPQGL